ncbi:hypothetical protein BSR26_00020 [Leuconostoc mesenteroides subsp. mesenteroides]|nr:hypothetical protein BSR26_00020 [Leuconostoc mesenteroides subsp. mesenteroides]
MDKHHVFLKRLSAFSLLANVIWWTALILLKIVLAMKHTISTLNDPIVASVSPTFTMSLK